MVATLYMYTQDTPAGTGRCDNINTLDPTHGSHYICTHRTHLPERDNINTLAVGEEGGGRIQIQFARSYDSRTIHVSHKLQVWFVYVISTAQGI